MRSESSLDVSHAVAHGPARTQRHSNENSTRPYWGTYVHEVHLEACVQIKLLTKDVNGRLMQFIADDGRLKVQFIAHS